MKKTYLNHRTEESTGKATQAYKWHLAGDLVQVNIYDDKGTLADVVHVPGVAQNQKTFDDENRETCKRIALEVEAYANGSVYRCPDCSEEFYLPDDVGDKFKCPHCGNVHDVDDLEQLSIYDYMSDVLDIDFTVNRYKEYKNCSVCVGWGGPNIYIETDSSYVKLYWGGSYAEYPLSYSARDVIDEFAEEWYNNL